MRRSWMTGEVRRIWEGSEEDLGGKWGGPGREVRRIWEGVGEGHHDQNLLYRKKSIFNKKKSQSVKYTGHCCPAGLQYLTHRKAFLFSFYVMSVCSQCGNMVLFVSGKWHLSFQQKYVRVFHEYEENLKSSFLWKPRLGYFITERVPLKHSQNQF